MNGHIVLLPGDGVGPEVIAVCRPVLEAVGRRFGHTFSFTEAPIGGHALETQGVALPEKTVAQCRAADAVLLGAVGGPRWDENPAHLRPETGLLGLRAALALYANLRPAVLYPCLQSASPLKPEISGGAFDILIVRELTGGLYYGARGRTEAGAVFDTMVYSEHEVERVGRRAFALARARRGHLTSVDKANVLDTSRLWRAVMHRLRAEYPDVMYEDMLVDNAAMQLVRRPGAFDVLVTENMFGDILSDEAGVMTGSIGLLPSASLGEGRFGLYEPVHGSAPDIAGQDRANPAAAVLSCALMLRHTFGLAREAGEVESAVLSAVAGRYKTADLAGPDDTPVGTRAFGALIVEVLTS
ncbi:MAG: 3-isopropylmalate dehydrogenase [Oscillospiraceae bacterium]|jgi:3-isopropylmalate dehydrogenase|nr:3-isopropylmalate dehydrogenase [Oscillospiraceae bacterium]